MDSKFIEKHRNAIGRAGMIINDAQRVEYMAETLRANGESISQFEIDILYQDLSKAIQAVADAVVLVEIRTEKYKEIQRVRLEEFQEEINQ